jgi:iron complex outermembrane receptor protein
MKHTRHRRALNACSASALAIAAGLLASPSLARAADAAVATTAPAADAPEVEQIVVSATPSQAATIVAPVRGALTATEPQAIITRKFIEEAAPRVGDFSTIAAYAPSMVATPQPNGAGLSDGGKISLRGFSDGNYNITYDGIAWGDTNGPSHHGTAFFPNSTIGGVIIDRGPGGATDLGPANFGGSVNLISLPLEANRSLTQVLTGGSFNTVQEVTTLQSGEVSQLHGAKFLANFQELSSSGYLTNNYTNGNSQMFKGEIPVTDRVTVTALYTHTFYLYNKSDIGDASVAQLEQFGRNFSLGSDTTLQDYYKYNWARKQTDFEYVKAEADLGQGFGFVNTVYSYGYDNDTESGANNLAAASANLVTPAPGATYPAPGAGYSSKLQTYGIPGYSKKNEYRVTGDIAKFTKSFDFGTFTVGTLYERSDSYRYIIDINVLNKQPDYREKASKTAGPSDPYTDVPLNDQYIEFSGWTQYQPFAQLEWKPIDRLTITPGIKYVHWDMSLDAPIEKLPNGSQPIMTDQVFTKTLPFLTVNYRIQSNWAIYAQYAQGFLIPNIGELYVGNLTSTKIQPQESTNYQIGTVYNRGNFTFDGDIYYIVFQHKIQSFTDAVSGQAYETNSGGAIYEGIELQGSYVLPHGFSVFANGSDNSAVGDNDPSNPLYNNHQLTAVPHWTAAAGVRFQHNDLIRSDDSVIVALNDKFVGSQYLINAKCSSAPNGICAANAVLTPVTGLIPSYSEADLSMTYRIGRYSIEGQVLNLFDSQAVTTVKGTALIPGSSAFALTSAQGGGANAPEYQVPRSYQITLRAKF